MSQRFEGRNIEEALTNASEALGVGRWQLTYHVLLEKRGFLGGVKRIVIEADVNQEAAPPAVAAAPAPVERAREDARPPRAAGERGRERGRARGGRGGGGGNRDERGGGRG